MISGVCEDAAAAVEKLGNELRSGTAELAAMQKALKNMQFAAKPNEDAINKLKEAITAKKEAIAKGQVQYIGMGGKLTDLTKKSASFEARLKAMAKDAKDLPGPLGGVLKKFGELAGLVGGGAIAAGLLAAAAAMAAFTAAMVIGTKALYDYGVATADAARSEALRLAGLKSLSGMKLPDLDTELGDIIDDVAASSPLARAEIVKMAEGLRRMGLNSDQIRGKLEDMAIPEDASERLLSLDVQMAKLKESQDNLFKGLQIRPYLAAWKEVRDLMSQNTASGRALKQLINLILQPLIDASTQGAPIVKRFFQGMIIAALQFTNTIIRLRAWWRQTFGSAEQKKGLDDGRKWVLAGKVALDVLIGAVALTTLAFAGLSLQLVRYVIPAMLRSTLGLLRFAATGVAWALGGALKLIVATFRLGVSFLMAAPAMWAALAPLLPFIAAALGLIAAIATLIYYWDELKIAFEQIDWAQAGEDIISGIISGLLPGPLIDAMMSLGSMVFDAFNKSIEAASPSKAFARAGLAIPQGVAQGVEEGTPEAQGAVTDMIDVPPVNAAQAAAAEGGGAGAARGAVSIEIGQVVVNASSSDPKAMALDFKRELELVLESLAAELGARPAGAPA